MPRKTSLNWFMPALVNSSVGSLTGTSEEECTSLCPLETKKSRNMRRTSEPESLRLGIGDEEILAFVLAAGLISNVALVSEPQIPFGKLRAGFRLARGGLAQDDKSKQSANFMRTTLFDRQPPVSLRSSTLVPMICHPERRRPGFWPPKSRDLRFPRSVTQRTDVRRP